MLQSLDLQIISCFKLEVSNNVSFKLEVLSKKNNNNNNNNNLYQLSFRPFIMVIPRIN